MMPTDLLSKSLTLGRTSKKTKSTGSDWEACGQLTVDMLTMTAQKYLLSIFSFVALRAAPTSLRAWGRQPVVVSGLQGNMSQDKESVVHHAMHHAQVGHIVIFTTISCSA